MTQTRRKIPGSQGRLGDLRVRIETTVAAAADKHQFDRGELLDLLREGHPAPSHVETDVVLVIRRRARESALPLPNEDGSRRERLSRTEYANRYGSDPQDIARILAFAHDHNLKVVDDAGEEFRDTTDAAFLGDSCARRMLRLRGTQGDLDKAFAIDSRIVYDDGLIYRTHAGHVTVPESAADAVLWVFGLESHLAHAMPHMAAITCDRAELHQHNITPVSLQQIESQYMFPDQLDGNGECIGILAPYGGYYQSDLELFFHDHERPVPKVLTVGSNDPDFYQHHKMSMVNIEAALDLQLASSLAPGATTIMYAPGTCSSDMRELPMRLYEILSRAIYDEQHRPSVLSLSWGGPETGWRHGDRVQLDDLLLDAACLGITVCVSSGDAGSTPPGRAGIQGPPITSYPASNPYVLACGGTSLEQFDESTQTFVDEVVWNDYSVTVVVEFNDRVDLNGGGASGGGVSGLYTRPAFQQSARVPEKPTLDWTGGELQERRLFVGRGVPDVAANADIHTGYEIRFNGRIAIGGGTSSAAPIWAALITRLNQRLEQPAGFLNPLFYRLQLTENREICREITSGGNGGFVAAPGWNACTGLGTPKGKTLLEVLTSRADVDGNSAQQP